MPLEIGAGTLRLVELLGAISLATDLGTGQPHFHGVRTSVLAVALGRELVPHQATFARLTIRRRRGSAVWRLRQAM
jgi:hypothetical protein